MSMETIVYDCFTLTDNNADSSDDDSMPGTPKTSAAEQIEALYDKLKCMRDELDRIHQEYEDDNGEEFLNVEQCTEGADAFGHEQYWDYADHSLVEERYPCNGERLFCAAVEEETTYMTPPTTTIIGKMPAEILMHVFELVLDLDMESSDDAAGFGGREGWRVPILLGQVCSGWRHLILKTSSLWASFSLVVERTPVSTGGLKASLDLWLQGSKTTTVAMNLEVDPACTRVLDGEIMGQLEELLSRCWRLRLNVSHEMFRGILNLRLPRLQTLEVRSSWIMKDIGRLNVQAPNLRTLAVLGPTMVRFTKDSLPWAQLREYRGSCWAEVQRHLDIVRLSSNLESCTLYPFYEMKGNAAPIRLTKLRRLHVVSYLGTNMGGLLRCLEVPVLKELRLEIPDESPGYGHSIWPKTSVLELLERSRVELEKMELIGMDKS